MKVLVAGRQEGKTTTALKYLRSYDDAVMLVHNYSRKHQIIRQHPELEGRIVTPHEEFRGRTDIGRVIVDDAGLILSQLLGAPVELMTVTGEPIENPSKEGEPPQDTWWLGLSYVVSETYNRVLESTEGTPQENHEIASYVAKIAAERFLYELGD